MPHIAPSTWVLISFLSFFSVAIIASKLSWSFVPKFPSLSQSKKFFSSWPWG